MKAENICAVIVLYHPDAEALKNIIRAKIVFKKTFVVDNSPKASNGRSIDSNEGAVAYIQNNENKGISVALNQGVNLALEEGFYGVVLLDQDTIIKPKLLDELLAIYNAESKHSPVAVVGAGYSVSDSGAGSKSVRTVITSGSLLNVIAFSDLGGFDERYFIDCVDLEFCLRASSQGFKVYKSEAALMEHFIGAATKHRFLGFSFTTSNHSGLRRYYLARNTIFLFRSYFKDYPFYTCSSLVNIVRISIYILMFEPDKFNKLKYMLHGLKDGLLNVSGKKSDG